MDRIEIPIVYYGNERTSKRQDAYLVYLNESLQIIQRGEAEQILCHIQLSIGLSRRKKYRYYYDVVPQVLCILDGTCFSFEQEYEDQVNTLLTTIDELLRSQKEKEFSKNIVEKQTLAKKYTSLIDDKEHQRHDLFIENNPDLFVIPIVYYKTDDLPIVFNTYLVLDNNNIRVINDGGVKKELTNCTIYPGITNSIKIEVLNSIYRCQIGHISFSCEQKYKDDLDILIDMVKTIENGIVDNSQKAADDKAVQEIESNESGISKFTKPFNEIIDNYKRLIKDDNNHYIYDICMGEMSINLCQGINIDGDSNTNWTTCYYDLLEVTTCKTSYDSALVGKDIKPGIYSLILEKGEHFAFSLGPIFKHYTGDYFQREIELYEGEYVTLSNGWLCNINECRYSSKLLFMLSAIELFLDENNSAEYSIVPPQQAEESIEVPINVWMNQNFYKTVYFLKDFPIIRQRLSYYNSLQYIIPIKVKDMDVFPLLVGSYTLDYESKRDDQYYDKTIGNLKQKVDDKLPYYWLQMRCERLDNPSFLSAKERILNAISRYEKWIKMTNKSITAKMKNHPDIHRNKWVAERTLFEIAHTLFPDAVFQYNPAFLRGQSLDIFIPSIDCAIEYQGEQHYTAIDFFGGEEGLEYRQLSDSIKAEYCSENNIILITWDYKERISVFTFIDKINEHCSERLSHKLDEAFLEKALLNHPKTMNEVLNANSRYSSLVKEEKKKEKEKTKEVYRQYSLEGTFLHEYSSVDAAAAAIGVGAFNINRVLAGTRKQAGGFQWKKEAFGTIPSSIAPLEKTIHTSKSKAVQQISLEGEIIRKYESVAEASRMIGINSKSIRQAANGLQNQAGGFLWQFVDE